MKIYVKGNAYKSYDTLVAKCGEYELREDRNGKYFVQGPDGMSNFNGSAVDLLPEDVWYEFAQYTWWGRKMLKDGINPYNED